MACDEQIYQPSRLYYACSFLFTLFVISNKETADELFKIVSQTEMSCTLHVCRDNKFKYPILKKVY